VSDLEWMAWTAPTAVFVAFVFSALLALALFSARHPPVPRKGFLPMVTSAGDRIYVGLLGTGAVLIALLALTTLPVLVGLAAGSVWMAVVVRWG
jgi:predicted small integral membrane protein